MCRVRPMKNVCGRIYWINNWQAYCSSKRHIQVYGTVYSAVHETNGSWTHTLVFRILYPVYRVLYYCTADRGERIRSSDRLCTTALHGGSSRIHLPSDLRAPIDLFSCFFGYVTDHDAVVQCLARREYAAQRRGR